MAEATFLADEHIPAPFLTTLESLGYDVTRVKDEFPEGTPDRRLLESSRETDRIAITCDTRFTVVDGEHVSEHGGVIYAEQAFLQTDPELAATGVDRIVATIPAAERAGIELYLSDWA